MKIRSKGSCSRSRDLLFKLWDPLISLEWLKVQTSNFAGRLPVRDNKPKNDKLVKRGRGLGHVTYFSNFGTPNICGMAEDTNLKFCTQIEDKGY